MLKGLETSPVSTILVVLFALVGGAITILHPETLNFKEYGAELAAGAGLLAIGRGHAAK